MASNGGGARGAETLEDVQAERWVAYHAWTAGRVGYAAGGVRSLRITTLGAAASPKSGEPFAEGPLPRAAPALPIGLRQGSEPSR
jgi:hypothetical protein